MVHKVGAVFASLVVLVILQGMSQSAAAAITITPSTLPNWTLNKAYSQPLTGSGGTGPYTFVVTVNVPPTGMTLSSAGVLSGTPTAAGTFTFTVKATDSLLATVSQPYTIVINPAVTVATATLPNWTLGKAYSQTVTATGGTGASTFAVTTGTLPAGLTLASGGLLSGTPTTAASSPFTITATDTVLATGSRAYTIVINLAVTVATATLPNWTLGKAYSQTVTATGGTGASTFAVTTGTLPAGLTLASGGLLSGTPTTAASSPFTITATDTVLATGSQPYTIVINPAVTVAPATLPNWTLGKAYSQTVTATGGTGASTFAVTTGTLPAGLTLAAGGLLSGTPTTAASSPFTITATDTVLATGSRAYTIVINPAVTVTTATLPNWTLGKAYSQTVTATGGTGASTFAVTTGTLPAGLTLAAGGLLSGTPTTAASSPFTITATDTVLATGSQAYTIVINPAVTVAPATLPNWTISKTGYSQTITSANGTGARILSISTGAIPTGMTFTAATGVLNGTPTTAGTYPFTVIATDTVGATGSQAYTIVINPAVTVTTATLPNWTLGKAYSQTVSITGGTGAATFAVTTGTLPAGLTLAAGGLLSGTPTTAASSPFTITATDTVLATGSQAYTIVINPAVTVAPATLPNWTISKTGYSQTITSANGTGARTLSISTGAIPTGMTFTAATGVLNGTSTLAGTYPFTITATDTVGATGSQAYTIVINAAVAVTQTTLPNWTLGKAYSQTVTTTGGTGASTFAVTTGILPAGLTLATGGLLSGTPTTAASSPFTITATDIVGATGLQAYTVVINPAVTVAPATLPNWTINQTGYSQTITSANGTGASTLSISTGAIPTGMTFTAATGVLNGTPTLAGTYNFTITATDTVGATGSQAYTIVINAAVAVTPATLPNWTLGKAYSQTVTATGGTGASTFAVTTGTLPAGLTLAAGGLLSGTLTAAGTSNFTITATDTVGATGLLAYTVVINAAVTVTPATLPNWTINKTGYSQTITSANGTGVRTLSVSTGAIPTGMVFTAGTGVLNGTPTLAGTYNFTITATDTVGATGAQAYTVIINPAVAVATATLPNWTLGKAYSQTVSTTGGTGAATFAVTTGTLPAGVTLAAGGLLSGTPTAAATSNFTITATDTVGATGLQAYTVIINPAISITTATLPNWTLNKSGYSQTIASTGGTGAATFAVTTGALPGGLTLAAGGLLSGMPTATGTFSFTITATDTVGATGSKAYTVIINPVVAVTTATLPNWTLNKSGYTRTIAAVGGTGVATFAVTTGALPGGLALTAAGVLSGTPTAAGTFNFTITATDTVGATGSKAYTVIISPVVVVTTATLPDWTANTLYSQTVSTSGGTGAVTVAVTLGSFPTGLYLSPAGAISGTPTVANTFNFTITATDTVGATGIQAYTVTINPGVVVTPASLPNWTVNQSGYSQTITSAHGTGVNTLSLSAGAIPAGMTFTAATGVLNGTPTATGLSNFTITSTDAVGATGSQTYTVIINLPVSITTLTLANWTANKAGYSQSVAVTGGTGASTFAVTVGSLPTGLALSTGGLLSGTPTAIATFNFTITATDGTGANASQAYIVVISGAAPIVAATPTSAAVTGVSATLGGSILSDGGAPITARGVVLAPTSIAGNLLTGGAGVTNLPSAGTTGAFTVPAASLSPSTAYSFAAYATNSQGTSYSSVGSFSTLSNNTFLSSLVLTPGRLAPAFSSSVKNYTVTLPNIATSITITPTVAQANATVQIDGMDVVSGHASDAFPLSVGLNNILVMVTAQDGTTMSVYTVAVTRAAAFISVQQPVGTALANGAAITDFGGAGLGKTVARVFTVKNLSAAVLTNFVFVFDGANPGEFTVTTAPAASLAVGGSTTFTLTFSPAALGARSATVHIDATGETLNPFTIALTGTGVAQPGFAQPPASQIVALHQLASFTTVATGGALSYQWQKTNVAIPGATSDSYNVTAAALTSAGSYTVIATNAAGFTPSPAANLGVISVVPATVTLINGTTMTLTASAAAPGITYQWRKNLVAMTDGSNPGNSLSTIAGAIATKLTVTKVAAADMGSYTCLVTMPDPQNPGTPVTKSSGVFTVNVTSKPVLDSFTAGPWIVGGAVSDTITAQNNPTSFTLSGQIPAGITIDAGGHFHGPPTGLITTPTTYHLVISASNAAGAALVPATADVTVNPLPAAAVGTFNGLVDRDADPANGLSANATKSLSFGGSLNITSLATGIFSGKLTLGTLSYSFVHQFMAAGIGVNPTARVVIPRTLLLRSLTLDFHIDKDTGELIGTLTDGVIATPVIVHAWRGTAPSAALVGSYTSVLDFTPGQTPDPAGDLGYPQGYGFGTLAISATGGATWTGKLSDGTTMTANTTMGSTGQVPLHSMIYITPGSAHGWVQVSLDSTSTPTNAGQPLLDGGLDWVKAAQAPSSTNHNYKAGFALCQLTAAGGKYVKPTTTVLGIIDNGLTTTDARLAFSDGGLAGPLPIVGASMAGNLNNTVFRITSANAVVMPAGAVANPATLSFVLTASTGAFSGSFVLKNDLDPTGTALLSRTVYYYGLLVQRVSVNKGVGFFLLSELPAAVTSTTPKTTLATSDILAGQVVLEAK